MFLMLEISPIVIIVIVLVLLSHVIISGAMIVTAFTILGVSAILTAGIIYAMTARMNATRQSVLTYERYREQLSREPAPTPVGQPQERPEAISGPREVHNHIHLDGLDADQVSEYLARVRYDTGEAR